jgi:AcrR family transcriptional regulator
MNMFTSIREKFRSSVMTEERVSKSEATRERILETALTLFADKGFANTTMREIAKEANCSLGLAYRYFETKDAMVLALYERLVIEFAEEVRTLPTGPLAQRWAQATRGDIARLEAHRGALMGLTSAGLAPGRTTQVLGGSTVAVRRSMLVLFLGLVTGARDAPKGEIAEALSVLFYALHLLLVFFWLQDPTPNQKTTHALIDFGEEMLGRLRLLLRLPWTGTALTRLAGILGPILHGSISSETVTVL